MGNEQSTQKSQEAHEAEAREYRAAIEEQLAKTIEEETKRLRQERAAELAEARAKASTKETQFEVSRKKYGEPEPTPPCQPSNKATKRAAAIESASEDDTNYNPTARKRKRFTLTQKTPQPVYKASVNHVAEIGTIKVTGSTADIDDAIMRRIKKSLDRANHPSAPESEAKAALYMASRYMAQYNVSQAEVLAHDTPDSQRQYGGHSIVLIERTDGDQSKPVLHHGYLDYLSHAMNVFFDTLSFSKGGRSSLEFTFNGIAENTVAAAMAFEMSYNSIAKWSYPYKGMGGKNSYRLGISEELYRMAKEIKYKEEEEGKKAERDAITKNVTLEQADRQARLDRLASLPSNLHSNDPAEARVLRGNADNPIWLDSDTDGEYGFDDDADIPDHEAEDGHEDCVQPDFQIKGERSINVLGEIDEEINKIMKVEYEPPGPTTLTNLPINPGSTIKEANIEERRDSEVAKSARTAQDQCQPQKIESEEGWKWTSHTQLVKFRGTAKAIAEDHIKDQNIKLQASPKKSRGDSGLWSVWSWRAGCQGA